MTLDEATAALLEAIAAEDIEAVGRALEARQAELQAGAMPTPDALEKGREAYHALAALQQKWAIESARLSQFEAGFAHSLEPAEPGHDCTG